MVIISQVASGMQADIDVFKVCSNPSSNTRRLASGARCPAYDSSLFEVLYFASANLALFYQHDCVSPLAPEGRQVCRNVKTPHSKAPEGRQV